MAGSAATAATATGMARSTTTAATTAGMAGSTAAAATARLGTTGPAYATYYSIRYTLPWLWNWCGSKLAILSSMWDSKPLITR